MKKIFRKLAGMLNLQMFADPAANVNATTDSGLSVENKAFYDKVLLEEAGPELVHARFGQKRPIPKNGGKKINFRKYAALPKAMTPITEGVTPAGKKLTATQVEAEVSQYGDYVCLSDVLDLTAIDNNIVEATKAIGKQAGLTLDTITRNVMQSGTNVFYAVKSDGTTPSSRSALNATCTFNVAGVRLVAAWLKANNAPKIGDSYVCILHPNVSYDLQNDPEWKEMFKYSNPQPMYEGEIGKIAGVRFVETSEAKIWNDSSCPFVTGSSGERLSVYGCLFLADGAYGVTEVTGGGLQTIIKQLGSGGTSDPLNQRATVGWKALQTAEILMNPYMVRVECVSSFGKTAAAN